MAGTYGANKGSGEVRRRGATRAADRKRAPQKAARPAPEARAGARRPMYGVRLGACVAAARGRLHCHAAHNQAAPCHGTPPIHQESRGGPAAEGATQVRSHLLGAQGPGPKRQEEAGTRGPISQLCLCMHSRAFPAPSPHGGRGLLPSSSPCTTPSCPPVLASPARHQHPQWARGQPRDSSSPARHVWRRDGRK